MEGAGLGEHINYELPITQEQLADAVALTSVHVNRTLMKLQEDGLITRNRRMITVLDWKKMMNQADFEPRYLHIRDRAPPPAARAGDGHDAVANAANTYVFNITNANINFSNQLIVQQDNVTIGTVYLRETKVFNVPRWATVTVKKQDGVAVLATFTSATTGQTVSY